MMKKRNAFLLVALIVLAAAVPSKATNQLTVYDNGDELSNTCPINLVYLDEPGTRSQVIFPASSLTEMINEPINSMTFYVTDDGITVSGGKILVSLAETSQLSFAGGYINEGLTQVALISLTAGVNELVINFDTPYIYHGDNLVVDTYVEEATDYAFNLFQGCRPEFYSAITRGEVTKFIPKTTFDYGTNAEYAAKVIPTQVTFNTVRAEREDVQTIVLKNIGQKDFTPTFNANAPFGVTAPNIVLAAGQSVEVPVTFAPQAEGMYSGTLTIDCGLAGMLSVDLSGTAIQAAADLTICDSTEYASYVPIYGCDIDIVNTEGQMIYPASMLTDMAGRQIFSLRFHTYEEVQMNGGVIQLSFKEVQDTAFATAALATDLIAVATVSPEYGGTDLVFDLQEPYDYQGGNLLIDCKVIEPGITNYRQTFFYGVPQEYNCGVYNSCWYGSVFDIEFVPFLPKVTFSYSLDGDIDVMRGDVNIDGAVNISDVTALIDILLSGSTAPAEADADLDGDINISDVTTLIDYLLSGSWK